MDKEQMKLTVVGPFDSDLLQDFIDGRPVSFQSRKGYKIYVGDAYEAYLERKREARHG